MYIVQSAMTGAAGHGGGMCAAVRGRGYHPYDILYCSATRHRPARRCSI